MSTSEFISPSELLKELRWDADRVVTNPFGDRVWLKQIAGGITDCCHVDEPCGYHAKLTHQAGPERH